MNIYFIHNKILNFMLEAFIYGVILAFGLILPLGAQNVFVFNQGAIQKNYINALPTVITAALCDTLLISLLRYLEFRLQFLLYHG